MYNNSPYKNIPEELINLYSMNGKIPIIDRFFDSSNSNRKIIWSKRVLDKHVRNNTEQNISGALIPWYEFDNTIYFHLHHLHFPNLPYQHLAVQ